MNGGFFIIINITGYAEPVPIIGPFETYDAAIARYWDRLIEAGYEPREDESAHVSYLMDDAVRIGQLEAHR